MLRAGYCVNCNKQSWRSVPDPLTGEPVVLWPAPDTRYLTYELGQTLVNSVCACPCCDCKVGDPMHRNAKAQLFQGLAQAPDRPAGYTPADIDKATLIGAVVARQRYSFWYTDAYGDWLKAHLRDYFKLPDVEAQAVVAQWEKDRTV